MAVRDVIQAAAGALGGGNNLYVEDVFSTDLYTGNGSTQTITNSIDLPTEGGMVWRKARSSSGSNVLTDTARGGSSYLISDSTAIEASSAQNITAFNTNGFSFGTYVNTSGTTYASWTFRKAPKFFDVVTYTGDGSGLPRQIAHSLGSVPGFIAIKRLNVTSDWTVWHRSVTGNAFLQTTDIWQSGYTRITTPNETTFTVGASTAVNGSGGTYVAYLFAHDAGGFGMTGTDNVISCGFVSAAGSVNLGYEPQWMLSKCTNAVGPWYLTDTARGWTYSTGAFLYPNSANAESSAGNIFKPTATGFDSVVSNYIYITIRKNMKS